MDTALPTRRLLDEDYVTAAFKSELAEMENEAVRRATIAILRRAHPRFFTGPATSTGKYHPDEFFSGPGGDPSGARPNEVNSPFGGQILHVKRVATLVRHLADWRGWCGVERELLLAGALCHDTAKFEDGNPHTVKLHEALVAPRIEDLLADPVIGVMARYILRICEGHSGRWGAFLPGDARAFDAPPAYLFGRLTDAIPELEQMLSIADYLASRNNIGKFNPGVVDWRAKAK